MYQFEIIDAAWMEIIRKHPELSIGPDGQRLIVKRDFMLNHSVIPNNLTEIPSTVSCVSMRECGGVTFVTDATGTVRSYSDRFTLFGSLELLKELGAVTNEVVSPVWIAATAAKPDDPFVSLMCVCYLLKGTAGNVVPVVPSAAHKKNAKKDHAAVIDESEKPERRRCKCSIIISSGESLSLVDVFTVEVNLKDSIESIQVDLNLVHCTVCVASGQGLVVVPIRIPVMNSIVANADEEKAARSGEIPDSLIPLGKLTPASHFTDRNIKCGLHLFPTNFYGADKASSLPRFSWTFGLPPISGEMPPVQKGGKSTEGSYEVAILFDSVPEWGIMNMHPIFPSASPAPIPTPAVPAAAAPKKGKVVAETTEIESKNENFLSATFLGSWLLSAPVSVFTIDENRYCLVLGLMDGSVLIWNTRSRTSLPALCIHPAPISCLLFSFSRDFDNDGKRFVVSGAVDGTICFSTLRPEQFRVKNAQRSIYSTGDLTFRQDIPDRSVISIHKLGNSLIPICLIEYDNQTIACYDFDGGELLGQLKLTNNNSPQDPKWRRMNRVEEIKRGKINSQDNLEILELLNGMDRMYVNDVVSGGGVGVSRKSGKGKSGKIPDQTASLAVSSGPTFFSISDDRCFCVLYRMDNKEDSICGLFSVAHLISHLYPFLSALIGEIARDTECDVGAKISELLSLLTPEERMYSFSGEFLPKSREMELRNALSLSIGGMSLDSYSVSLRSLSTVDSIKNQDAAKRRRTTKSPTSLVQAAIEEALQQKQQSINTAATKKSSALASRQATVNNGRNLAPPTANSDKLLIRMKNIGLRFNEAYALSNQ